MKSLNEKKMEAKEAYKEARRAWMEYANTVEAPTALEKVNKIQSGPQWDAMQEAYRICRLCGVLL